MSEIVTTYTYPQGKVTVRRPELPEVEYQKRMKEVNKAATQVLKEKQKAERIHLDNEKLCV